MAQNVKDLRSEEARSEYREGMNHIPLKQLQFIMRVMGWSKWAKRGSDWNRDITYYLERRVQGQRYRPTVKGENDAYLQSNRNLLGKS